MNLSFLRTPYLFPQQRNGPGRLNECQRHRHFSYSLNAVAAVSSYRRRHLPRFPRTRIICFPFLVVVLSKILSKMRFLQRCGNQNHSRSLSAAAAAAVTLSVTRAGDWRGRPVTVDGLAVAVESERVVAAVSCSSFSFSPRSLSPQRARARGHFHARRGPLATLLRLARFCNRLSP